MDTVFNPSRGWLDTGEYFDDVQWVSIAYGRDHDVANQIKYYDIATTALDSTSCRGGIFWSKARDYKNAITSELYMTTSGYLWDSTKDEKYLKALKDSELPCRLHSMIILLMGRMKCGLGFAPARCVAKMVYSTMV